jgi:trans-2,3-dihydro-3-hydroxyanthranilate isomerase
MKYMISLSVEKALVFTDHISGGNPAGIVHPETPLSLQSMTSIADILNPVSETVFVSSSRTAHHTFRFFTSQSEIDICGHATIGAFFSLYHDVFPEQDTLIRHVETNSGLFPVTLHFSQDTLTSVMMNQGVPQLINASINSDTLCDILHISSSDLISSLPLQIFSTGRPKLMVPLRSIDTLNSLRPDFPRMIDFCENSGTTGIHAFTFETIDEASSLHCRHFAPAVGVNEDPATGNSNAAMAGYLINNNYMETEHLVVEQGYAMGRPSNLHIVVDRSTGEVSVGGGALIVMKGLLFIEHV